jgi:hypothetical protein
MRGSGLRKRLTEILAVYRERGFMISTLVIILVVLWLLGMVSSYTMGGVIHILLVVAVVVVLLRVIQGRRLQ